MTMSKTVSYTHLDVYKRQYIEFAVKNFSSGCFFLKILSLQNKRLFAYAKIQKEGDKMEKSNLWNLVKKGQEGDKKSMEELYNMFMPLLKKYAYLTHTEDALSEITLSFIEGIMKMPINKDNFKNSDKYILSYINTTVKHEMCIRDRCLIRG